MRRNHHLLLFLVLSPSLALADHGKSKKWWPFPLIMLLYIGFFLFAATIALCIRVVREHRRRIDNHNGLEMATERGLDAEEIESLPSLRFSEMKLHRLSLGEHGNGQVECAVCLAEFKDQEVIRILPDCFHVFHTHCIAPWLASHVTCPTCRSSLEHRQGSSLSRSSIFDGISGPLSQRFDHSSEQNHNHNDDEDHVTVDIEGASQSEINLDISPKLASNANTGRLLCRSHSEGHLMVHMVGKYCTKSSTSSSSLLPKESSPKSDYHITTLTNNNVDNWSSIISTKSDRFVDYSSLILVDTTKKSIDCDIIV